MRSVIFDLDGTLADTSGDMIHAANATLQELGLRARLDPEADAGVGILGGREMLRLGFAREGLRDPNAPNREYARLLGHYRAHLSQYSFVYEGALEAIEALKADGYLVGICTNKPVELAEELLQRLGVRSVFGALVGQGTLAVKKPDPQPLWETIRRLGGDLSRGCLVGDTATDHKTALAAGLPSILVTFGPNGAAMPQLKPEALLERFVDLPQIVRGLNL